MTIKHWIEGDITNKGKRGSNQHKKKAKTGSKVKAGFTIVGCLVAVAVIIYGYNTYVANPTAFAKTVTENVQQVVDDLTPEDRAKLNEQQALIDQEAEVMAAKAKNDAEYKAINDSYESKLASIREKKASFK